MNSVVVSVVDIYNSPPISSTRPSHVTPKLSASHMTTPYTNTDSHSDRLTAENSEVERTIVAPPRKRIRYSSDSCSPSRDCVEVKTVNPVVVSTDRLFAGSVLTPTSGTATSFRPAQTLPLSARVTGTVWQAVQSQAATAAVSAASGWCSRIFFCFARCVCTRRCG